MSESDSPSLDGATVDVVSTDDGEVQTVNNDLESASTVDIDEQVADVSADDYDAVLLSGGTVGADRVRADDEAVEFVWTHVDAGGRREPSVTAPRRSSRRSRRVRTDAGRTDPSPSVGPCRSTPALSLAVYS